MRQVAKFPGSEVRYLHPDVVGDPGYSKTGLRVRALDWVARQKIQYCYRVVPQDLGHSRGS
jgi:hypothetical protein